MTTGWLFGKDADQAGISVASAQEGSACRRNASAAAIRSTKAETTWELSYLHQLKSWLTLEPDVQFVSHPAADAQRRGALVLQLRSEITI